MSESIGAMSSKGSYAAAAAPSSSGGRFYNPPPVRRQQQMLLQQQQQMMQRQLLQQQKQQQRQLQRAGPVKPNSSASGDVEEAEKWSEGDVSSTSTALSVPPSVGCATASNVTNLDRLLESVTPYIPAQILVEAKARGQRMLDVESHSFYCLEDLWESFNEWSVYGAGVPLVLNGEHRTEQYYVPFLSGMQLYIDPSKPSSQLSGACEENDAEFHRLPSIAGSSHPEAERKCESILDANMRGLNGLSLGDKSVVYSSRSKADNTNSPGLTLFEYMEHEQPHCRKPLTDKISALASENPELNKCSSCDLLPTSWICVAWYPIYRIPIGPTLRDLDACFLTFHSLSTQSRNNWLQRLQVILPDYQFFRAHYSHRR
ncbi:hypothetical protein CDL12_29753 [Handroanthus impetiginosus]|uniref:Uncharacterized protein n=1 Tax=Handroanthus impetiginosus TaxID=429701 RepID=A0A2G9FY12_9LAMI|nr:hypothetical protein CDL12_29753 [Handroanthus impetiginosus]